ncbi:MAG: aldo-keto reductase family protein, partial [Planctomycetota bacterium]
VMPHTSSTDTMLDKRARVIRGMDKIAAMTRERGMIPGLSTHEPESIVFADETGLDVATYISIYNAAGFLMPIEIDWVNHVIHNAKNPVITIKPFASGRLHPFVGLAFSWSTLRPQDMVTVGTMTPDEAKEVIELSLSHFERRKAEVEMQITRSKQTLVKQD